MSNHRNCACIPPRSFFCWSAVLLGLVLVRPASATILLFDQQRDASTQSVVEPTTSGGILPSDYGDNVTGAVMAVPGGFFTYGNGGEGFTANVTLDIYSDAGTATEPRVKLWQDNYGDLENVIFAEGPGVGGGTGLNIVFSADPGYVVDLYSFDLGGWSNADYTIAAVEVYAGATTLFSATDVLVQGDLTGPRHTTIAFDEPLSAPELFLRLDFSNLSSGIRDNIGLDSVRFGQAPPPVPEPGTATLVLAGFVLFLASWMMHRVGSLLAMIGFFRKPVALALPVLTKATRANRTASPPVPRRI